MWRAVVVYALTALILSGGACRSGGGGDDLDSGVAGDARPAADAAVRDRHQAGPYRAYLGTLHDHHYGKNAGDDGGLKVGAQDEPGITGSPEWFTWRQTHPENYVGGDAVSAYATAASEGLDFFALTPHNHLINTEELGAVLAAQAGASGVVALVGQEWSSIESGNHAIVMNVVQKVGVANGEYNTLVQNWLPGYVAGHPLAQTMAAQRPFLIFAHPAYETSSYGPAEKAALEYGIDDFGTRAAWAAGMNQYAGLIELISSSLDAQNGLSRALALWNDGLRAGVSVGPDNHRQQWGTRSDARVGVLSTAWAAEQIAEGLGARRTYATEDEDLGAHLAVLDALGGSPIAWMGEAIDSPGGTLTFQLGIEDPTNPGDTYNVQVLVDPSIGGALAAQVSATGLPSSFAAGTREFTVATPPSGGYVIVHVTASTGASTWFSPIWIN